MRYLILGLTLVVMSCGKVHDNEIFKSEPIIINDFLSLSDKKVETKLIKNEGLVKMFNNKYISFKKYNSKLSKLNFRCCSDYLLTGVDKEENEHFISFYTQYPDAGSELWDILKVGMKEDSINNILKLKKVYNMGAFNYLIEDNYLTSFSIDKGEKYNYVNTIMVIKTTELNKELDSVNMQNLHFKFIESTQ